MFKAVVPQLCRLKREEAKANTTSRLKRRTDPKGQYRDTTYFKDNTIQQISYPNASPSTASVNFTYDTVYNRVATMVDGTGTTTYTYYPVTTGGTLGAAQLATVDGPLSNDTISYTYDELGRFAGRSINGVAASQTYDELGRTPSVTNVLGTFNYSYVNQTARVQSVVYPNGQVHQLRLLSQFRKSPFATNPESEDHARTSLQLCR